VKESGDRQSRLNALARQVRLLGAQFEALSAAVAERASMNRTDVRALELIGRRGGLTAGELAHQLNLTTGAVTGVIDRLEKMGHAQRRAYAGDRRRVVVEATEEASRLGREIFSDLQTTITDQMGRYTDEQLGLIEDCVNNLSNALGEHVRGLQRTMTRAGAGPN
jgi:DNA-binding MarR family transcriptional regulator